MLIANINKLLKNIYAKNKIINIHELETLLGLIPTLPLCNVFER